MVDDEELELLPVLLPEPPPGGVAGEVGVKVEPVPDKHWATAESKGAPAAGALGLIVALPAKSHD